jgi:hypothetical protein
MTWIDGGVRDWLDAGRDAIKDHKSPNWLSRGDTVKWTTTRAKVAAWVVEDQSEVQQVKIRMIGDDREFFVDRDEVEIVGEDDFCGTCGGIGCGWG